MQISNAIGAEFRSVGETTHNGVDARVVAGERLYDASREDVFAAMTDPARIARWFSPVSGDLRLGGRYQIEGNAGGEITRCDPPEALDVTWEFAGSVSWVTVRLQTEGDGTRLSLRHIIGKDEKSEAHWRQYGPGATGVGWDLSMLGLALYFEGGGENLDREAIHAWMASAAGKTFIRRCADGWAKAHIAGGEKQATAEAMAKATGDFYTGA